MLVHSSLPVAYFPFFSSLHRCCHDFFLSLFPSSFFSISPLFFLVYFSFFFFAKNVRMRRCVFHFFMSAILLGRYNSTWYFSFTLFFLYLVYFHFFLCVCAKNEGIRCLFFFSICRLLSLLNARAKLSFVFSFCLFSLLFAKLRPTLCFSSFSCLLCTVVCYI